MEKKDALESVIQELNVPIMSPEAASAYRLKGLRKKFKGKVIPCHLLYGPARPVPSKPKTVQLSIIF